MCVYNLILNISYIIYVIYICTHTPDNINMHICIYMYVYIQNYLFLIFLSFAFKLIAQNQTYLDFFLPAF